MPALRRLVGTGRALVAVVAPQVLRRTVPDQGSTPRFIDRPAWAAAVERLRASRARRPRRAAGARRHDQHDRHRWRASRAGKRHRVGPRPKNGAQPPSPRGHLVGQEADHLAAPQRPQQHARRAVGGRTAQALAARPRLDERRRRSWAGRYSTVIGRALADSGVGCAPPRTSPGAASGRSPTPSASRLVAHVACRRRGHFDQVGRGRFQIHGADRRPAPASACAACRARPRSRQRARLSSQLATVGRRQPRPAGPGRRRWRAPAAAAGRRPDRNSRAAWRGAVRRRRETRSESAEERMRRRGRFSIMAVSPS